MFDISVLLEYYNIIYTSRCHISSVVRVHQGASGNIRYIVSVTITIIITIGITLEAPIPKMSG